MHIKLNKNNQINKNTLLRDSYCNFTF